MKHYDVELTRGARKDLEGLEGSQRNMVLKALVKLQSEPFERGFRLGRRQGGDLTGLFKLVVGNRTIRVIYEVNEDNRITIVWVIAQRSDDECYELAYSRIPAIGSSGHRDRIRSLLDNAFGRSSGD